MKGYSSKHYSIFKSCTTPKTILINKSWLFIEDNVEDFTSLIFKENNNLVMLKGNKITYGKWEQLASHNLLIEINNKKNLLELYYIDKVIIALNFTKTQKYLFLIDEYYKEKVSSYKFSEIIKYIEKRDKKQEDLESISDYETINRMQLEQSASAYYAHIDSKYKGIYITILILLFTILAVLTYLGFKFIGLNFLSTIYFILIIFLFYKEAEYIGNIVKKYICNYDIIKFIRKNKKEPINPFLKQYLE